MPSAKTISLTLCLALLLQVAPSLHAFTEDPNRLIRSTAPRSPEEERQSFHVPEGFEVQLFADDEQLGGKPINMNFDARGRLWVTSTQEYPYAVKKEKWAADSMSAPGSKDSIRILEDTKGGGRADKVTIFARDMNISTGVLPYKNGCIAWSIPNLLFLQDTQHKGRAEQADQRRILFGPLGYERDTHGMISSLRLGLDGWIYATHGFSNVSHFQVLPQNQKKPAQALNPEPRTLNSQSMDISSGSIFRFRPDGSAVQLWTCGQVNPFGLCWDSWGNFYSADCHSNPITQLIRGATYPQFGKTTDPLGFGPVMCEHAHGSTGIAGIVYLDGGVWGPDWDDHMFVGNPVTSKVNHDHITFIGSSPKANEQPDFITCDDPWFRPVDLQLGPDGALYIADFYNKIIGHYEIPLDHPGRDRKSGRIWRVVKKGFTRKLRECDLSAKTPEQLLAVVNKDPNVNTRHLACAELIQRGKFPGDLSRAIVGPTNRWETSGDRAQRQKAAYTLDVPEVKDLMPLAEDLQKAGADDAHLRHALRIALRSVLEQPGAYAALGNLSDATPLRDELIRISVAVPSAEAAGWLLSQLNGSEKSGKPLDRVLLTQCLTHIARHLPAEREGELLELVQKNFANDLDTQLDLFFAVQQGQQARGNARPDARTQQWAAQLAQRLLGAFSKTSTADWEATTPPTTANPSPWFSTKRSCADGVEADFLDSHPPGGEKLTGTLRSKAFLMPDALTFWLAGHRGPPKDAPHKKNVVRLLDADSGEEIARVYPPRHDAAQSITWRCDDAAAPELKSATPPATKAPPTPQVFHLASNNAGRSVRLEVVDGDSGSAYAWLALGRFNPAVLSIPDLKSPSRDHRVLALAKLSAPEMLQDAAVRMKCLDLLAALPDKGSLSPDTRFAIAEKLASRHSSKLAALLAPLVRDPAHAALWMDLLSDPNADLLAPLGKLLKTATYHQQTALAELLSATREGVVPLLALAPPAVLAEPLVSSKIKALGDASLTERLGKLTSTLPPPNVVVNALISQRLHSFDSAKADKEKGQQVFTQTCTACHRIGITGNLVGPQLDGIGVRGPERLLEDILDPNREVDPAFRLHILKLKDGSVTTGLVRREQDGALVYADITGAEHSVPKSDVTGDDVSPFSLMPSGMGEVLTEEQLHNLLAYLLDRK